MSRKPTPTIDYTSRDYEAFRELLIKKLQEKMPEYTDVTETDAGIVILEALANGLDILSLYADVVANDVLLPTTQSRRLAVLIANCLGYYPYNQTSSEYEQVFVLTSPRTVNTIIPSGTVVKTKSDSNLATMYFVTTADHCIPAGCIGDEKDSEGNYLHTVHIVAGEVVKQDVIGTSTGAPMQSFMASYTHVIVDSLQVYVDEGTGAKLWKRVDTFFDCDMDSRVYVVSVDEFDRCTIQFGNGLKGRIPLAFPNGIYANYRIGGGEASNLAPGAICVVENGIAHVKETFNLEISVQGHDKETLESIKVNAPAYYRSHDRLVTLKDYEDCLRINFFDFISLKAIRDTTDRRLCHIYYQIREGHEFNEVLRQRVDEYIISHSMIGCLYDIQEYVPQPVNLDIKMYVDKDYDPAVLDNNARTYLSGVIFKYGNLDFGESLVKTDVEREIQSTFSGIISFRINAPTEDIISPTAPQNILTLGEVNIKVEVI